MGLCYNISRAHGPISRFWAPKTTKCPFCMQIFLNIASKFLSMLFRDQFCCALNMMLLCVSAIIALELMALLLSLGALAPKITPCHLNVLTSLIVASLFHIFAVYGSIGLCFGYDSSVGSCYHISRAHGPISRFGVYRGP